MKIFLVTVSALLLASASYAYHITPAANNAKANQPTKKEAVVEQNEKPAATEAAAATPGQTTAALSNALTEMKTNADGSKTATAPVTPSKADDLKNNKNTPGIMNAVTSVVGQPIVSDTKTTPATTKPSKTGGRSK